VFSSEIKRSPFYLFLLKTLFTPKTESLSTLLKKAAKDAREQKKG
jgi:hypothetical protein